MVNEPHNYPVRNSQQQQRQQRRYYQCNKGCGQEIHFDANSKSQSGKWIPLSKDTGLPTPITVTYCLWQVLTDRSYVGAE